MQYSSDESLVSIGGDSSQVQTLIQFKQQQLDPVFLTLDRFSEELKNVEGGTIQLPSLDVYSKSLTTKPIAAVDLNNQRLENISTLDISSLDSILATSKSAVNVQTMSAYNTFNVPLQIASLTNTILPFTTTTSMKDRTIINAGDPRPYTSQSTPAEITERLKDVVTVGYFNVNAMRRNLEGEFYDANNDLVKNLKNATIYKDADVYDQVPDPLEQNVFNPVLNQSKLTGFKQQAVNLGTMEDNAVTLNTENRNAYDSRNRQIKKGMQATDPKDYVTLDQVVAQEVAELQFELVDGIGIGDPVKHVKMSGKMFTVRDPIGPPDNTNLDKMRVIGSADPAVFQNLDTQVANMKQVNKKLDKDKDIDMKSEHRVINLIQPESSHHAVNKAYCDSNSSKNQSDGTGAITGLLGGALGGAISGAIVGTLGQGLTGIGGITGSLVSGGAALGTGMLLGNVADFARPGVPGSEQLIDNLKDDIANGGQQPPNPVADGGALMNGAMSVSGLLSAARNVAGSVFQAL